MVSLVVLATVIGIAWEVILFVSAGSNPLAYEDEAARLARVLELVLRDLRTARRVLLPPLYPAGLDARPQVAGVCYVLAPQLDGVLFHFRDGALSRTVIDRRGRAKSAVLATGLRRVAFSPLAGVHPRVRVALAGAGAVLVGQAALLNGEPAIAAGGGDGAG
jgi:hypothetical protein